MRLTFCNHCVLGITIAVVLGFSLVACGAPTETHETRAIRVLQAALPASTRAAEGLPAGGWVARWATDTMTVTLPLNTDSDIERGLRANRAALVRGAAQLFDQDSEIAHLVLMGTLPYGPDRTEVPLLVGDIRRADVVAWDKTSDQLGIWKMTVPPSP